jgi:signal transduction histidine kinase
MQLLHLPTQLNRFIFTTFIKPRSNGVDSQRQEYILNILLAALASITTIALLISGYHFTQANVDHYVTSFISTVIFSAILYGLVWLSRSGHYRLSSYIFIGLLSLTGLQLLIAYSFELPVALLLCATTIVISSVLLSARTGLIFTVAVSVVVITIGYFQLTHRLQPELGWFEDDFNFGDATTYSIVLGLIGVVTWLSNREIDRSLRRARSSEAALALERDSLEVKVVERTRELERTQLLRTMELQRFAEFGRLSANLLHEMASPLTAASLNLELLSDQESEVVSQARRNLQQIERYVLSARSQLQNQEVQLRFSVKVELSHIVSLLLPHARNSQLKLRVRQAGSYWLYGNPVKFNQLIGNLILNAIDASKENEAKHTPAIDVDVSATRHWVTIVVSDWGNGIAVEALPHIFEPFFTTKADTNHGMGIGLAMVKDFVEQEFHGSISVTSSLDTGTIFTVKLKRSQT